MVVSVTSHVGAVIGDGHQVPLPRPDGQGGVHPLGTGPVPPSVVHPEVLKIVDPEIPAVSHTPNNGLNKEKLVHDLYCRTYLWFACIFSLAIFTFI